MEIKKNENYTAEITDMAKNGEGIGKIDGFAVFVNGAVVGDIVELKIIKIKKNYGWGKLLNVITPSKDRVPSPCSYFPRCGGCAMLHTDYKKQLEIKRNEVCENLKRIGGIEFDVPLPISADNIFRYRNKAQMPVGADRDGKPIIGFFSRYSHRITDISDCLIQSEKVKDICDKIREFIDETGISIYNEETHKGIFRHILIRTGKKTGEISVTAVINSNSMPYADIFVSKLKKIEGVKSITANINKDRTNAITGSKLKTLFGVPWITDKIGELKFEVSPLSFFQVNPEQTEKLYNTALEFADPSKEDTIFDAYCGTGTISLFLAQKAKKVYGIEIVPDAIENAEKNAKINNIENAEFIVGKSEEEIPNMIQKGIKPDVIVLDPPRKGCDEKLLNAICKSNCPKIVYVSCDPATLARDIKYLLQNGYALKKVQPVDMFCHSLHIETVCLLSRKN